MLEKLDDRQRVLRKFNVNKYLYSIFGPFKSKSVLIAVTVNVFFLNGAFYPPIEWY